MPLSRRGQWTVSALVLIACALTLTPHRGPPPPFRYAGSHPAREVAIFGWPLATAVYDDGARWQTGQGFVLGPLAPRVVTRTGVVGAVAYPALATQLALARLLRHPRA